VHHTKEDVIGGVSDKNDAEKGSNSDSDSDLDSEDEIIARNDRGLKLHDLLRSL
jgi:hypothetical protein